MKIARNPELERHLEQIPRDHPWHEAVDPLARYYDFKTHPELVSSVLEDYKKYEPFEAIHRFYDLIVWLNSPDSVLESNDCLLRGLNSSFSNGYEIRGHVTLFLRSLPRNVDIAQINLLCSNLEGAISAQPEFSHSGLDYARWPTRFVTLKAEGQPFLGWAINLRFIAQATDEREAMGNLCSLFSGTHSALREVSRLMT